MMRRSIATHSCFPGRPLKPLGEFSVCFPLHWRPVRESNPRNLLDRQVRYHYVNGPILAEGAGFAPALHELHEFSFSRRAP